MMARVEAASRDRSARPEDRLVRLGFVMEQTLGHVTHYTNLRAALDTETDIDAAWYPLAFPPSGQVERIPPLRSNWSIRASWRTWRELSHAHAAETYDALFFHTQVTALLSASLMRRVPSVVSLDATPLNYDVVGVAYGHKQGGSVAEGLKRRLNIRSLTAAGALVTWCDWARQSLIRDYGVEGRRITVIPPGVNLNLWPHPALRPASDVVRLLFVGGDFDRKGGKTLLEAFSGLNRGCELHIVTREPVEPRPGIYVYQNVAPNSDLLRHLYATADIFVLPTLADCFPLVIQEAMAAGLPIVTTDIGAIGEAVHHGETGLLVPPNNPSALRSALAELVGAPERRARMGARGRQVAEHRYDSAINARLILNIMKSLVREPAQEGPPPNGRALPRCQDRPAMIHRDWRDARRTEAQK